MSFRSGRASERKVPVTAFVEDMAASGGYWLACAAENIYVTRWGKTITFPRRKIKKMKNCCLPQRSSIVGSIGVIFAGFGFQVILQI